MEIIAVKEHFEVFQNGKFFCSCDNYDEAMEEMEELAAWEDAPLAG